MFRRSAVVAAVLAAALAPAPCARAWTDASVTRVAADVDVPPDRMATVSLAITVHVRGGWLEQLELVGLDPGLELVDPPPRALDAEGVAHLPTTHVEPDGRVLLAFPRGDAPHRGDALLSLTYRARLAPELDPERDAARVRWTLPPWEAGLDGASLVLHVPGTATVPAEIACPSCEVDTVTAGGVTTLTLRRTHLPRATPWDVALDVPRDALALPPAIRPPPLVSRSPVVPPAWPAVLALAAVIAALGVAKRAAFRRALAARGAPLPPRSVGVALVFLAAALAATVGAVRLAALGPLGVATGLAALVALALRGTPAGHRWPRAGAFRTATRAELAAAARAPRAAWWSLAAAFDATTPLGALVLALCAVGSFVVARHLPPSQAQLLRVLPLLAAPLFVSSTRFQLPPTALDRLGALRQIASRLRVPDGVALMLVVHEDTHGVVQEARLRLVLREPPEGLTRLDVAIAVVRGAGGFVFRPVCLAVVSAAGAPQRAIAAARLPGDATMAPGGRRVCHLCPLAALPQLLAALGVPDVPVTPAAAPRRMSGARARGPRLNAIVAE